jgi:FAD/FMN-containing dehydrogenase
MSVGTVHSWGRYPKHPQCAHAIHWRDELADDYASTLAAHGSVLPYGNGRSYGDSCLAVSNHVLHMRPLARFITADWVNGIVVAEAGVTLGEILSIAVPNGWFLPVTPGTKFVTLGGAIANDVHGKNHHARGTFGRHIRRFRLVRSDRAPVTCSGDENTELFCATIGGLGLTGVIEWAELHLAPIKSSFMNTTTIRFSSLKEFFALSAEFDGSHEYTVAWVDCLAKGRSAGRGVFIAADHSAEGGLRFDEKKKLAVPFTPPFSAINKLSLAVFNLAYFHLHKSGRQRERMGYEPFFYPLDGVLNWNRIYGPRGFQQYQCVIPDSAAEPAMLDLLKSIAERKVGSFLAVMKKCGAAASPGLLSFPLAGTSLALDFPQQDEVNQRLFRCLDAIVRDAGGRLYAAKDAHMSGEDFRNAYPNWARLETLRDPGLASRFWQRVTTE